MSEQFRNNYTTLLNGAINSTDTTIVVDDAVGLTGHFRIKIEDEIIYIRNVDLNGGGVTFSQCKRGMEGTTAASHADNTEVKQTLTAEALVSAAANNTYGVPLYKVGLVDSWNDASNLVTSGGQTLATVTRHATSGPNSEPSFGTLTGGGTNQIAEWVLNVGDIVQVEVDVKTLSGGSSFLQFQTDAGTFNINNDGSASWEHKRAVFTIGATGILIMKSVWDVEVANLFIYKIPAYPVLTAWDAGDANTTLDNGETWGGNSSRVASGGLNNLSYIQTDAAAGAGPTTMITFTGLCPGQVYRLEGVMKPINGGGTEVEAVVNAGTTVINSNNTLRWQFFAANVTVGTSRDIALRNNYNTYIQDFKVIQIGA